MNRRAMAGFLLVATLATGCRSGSKQLSPAQLASKVPAPEATTEVIKLGATPALISAEEAATRRLPEVDPASTTIAPPQVQQASFRQPEPISPAQMSNPQPEAIQGWRLSEPIYQPTPVGAPVRLNLVSAIEKALEQNPDLVAIRANEGVSSAAFGVASTYPFNPFVQVQATPFQQRRDGTSGAVYHYVLLMQTIQLAHQQRYREQLGASALNSVRWNIQNSALLAVAQTERLYFTALYLRGLRDLTKTNADLNAQLLSVLDRQLKEGAASGVDVATVRMDNDSTQRQALLAETNYQTALLDLRRQLDISPNQPLELNDDLTKIVWFDAEPRRLAKVAGTPTEAEAEPKPEPALERLVAARPDVMAALADVDTARANVRVANASRVPDLQIGPYYQRTDSGTDFYGFRAHMEAPIFNNGVPLLRQREAELRQRTLAWRQLQTRATLEAGAAIDRYERARRLVKAGGVVTNQELPLELQKLEEQFLEGEVDIVRLFQARTSTIQNRRAELDTLNEVAQSAAQVTASTAVLPQFLAAPVIGVEKPQHSR